MDETANQQHGFSLLEALVAIFIAGIIFAAASTLVVKAFNMTDLVLARAEMQQDARAAINSITRDLSLAGTGMPVGGLQLPAGAGSTLSLHGCSGGTCYLKNNTFGVQNHLFYAWPDPGDNNVQQGVPDSITIAYIDNSINLGTAVSINPSGSQVQLNSVAGVNIGDLILLRNNGAALGMVTNVIAGSNKLDFAANDPLNINQPGAAQGNIASLGPGGNYGQVNVYRILLISYYLQQNPGPDGVFGTDDDIWQLMRQVGGQPPSAVMDGVDNLQFTYDIYDDTSNTPGNTLQTNTKSANGTPGLIRKVNVVLSARSPKRLGPSHNFAYLTLAVSVSPRNLSFRDRYN